ncbi:MarR family transcriptional regulator [Palleronia sediminis]|uniref:MarR family transcriptional regulator n=1 Tax=Palleronia sediminis TaxID=2547833 RepID=A0A4R6A189_9RHOB|nr:MarR family transcriptional regulator [Palleronia sediminis]TDL76324.1 MarR family transcriptional regulator [Palleronia sediminis]
MADTLHTPDRIAQLLVHLGRAARCETSGSDLTAAQWTCLRFFAHANRSTRTPSAFASFQATTRGTASQIVKSLERQGLVTRRPSARDGRSVCFDLSPLGQAMLERDPLGDLVGVIDILDRAERDRFLATLSRLSSALAVRRDGPAFGTCADCGHFGTSGNGAYCACMAAELAEADIVKLCASYTPTPGPASEGERDGAA